LFCVFFFDFVFFFLFGQFAIAQEYELELGFF